MGRIETPWGPWDAFTPAEVAALLGGYDRPWWIAGGYAIDALCGSGRREHADVDIGMFADDQLAIRAYLEPWDVQAADPPGTLRPWAMGEVLGPEVHDIWIRADGNDAWRFQLMLDTQRDGMWIYRRDRRVKRTISKLTWEKGGIRYLAPEIQLLYKCGLKRPKDGQDWRDALPCLGPAQRQWLLRSLRVAHPEHPWIEEITQTFATPFRKQ